MDQAEGFDAARGVRHEAERGFAAQVVDQSPAQACNVGCSEDFVRGQREESGHGGRIGGATEGARQTQAMFGHAHQAAMRHEEGFEITTHGERKWRGGFYALPRAQRVHLAEFRRGDVW